jgi:hypothetical protein
MEMYSGTTYSGGCTTVDPVFVDQLKLYLGQAIEEGRAASKSPH